MPEFNYNKESFLLNGEPFVVRAGAIHYFRIPVEYWHDRLLKLKECGFNTVETYVAWNLHEPEENEYRFDGEYDVCKFIELAGELGLKVMLRVGPYICAEFDGGGFPYWLYKYDGIKLRSKDPVFMEKTERWLGVLFNRIRPYFIGNGGNIIIVQVENEYASYGNDSDYIKTCIDVFRKNDVKCLLCTSDGGEDYYMSGVKVDEVPVFANFGSQVEENMTRLKRYHPDQPPFCAEFWCGWFDHWYENHHVRDSENVVEEIKAFIRNDWSFNVYMFCGGTSFGFLNGANFHDGVYRPIVTSYDYCAPLTEAGDRTKSYYAVREALIAKGVSVPEITAEESKKRAYGKVEFLGKAELFDNLDRLGSEVEANEPKSMEQLGQAFGYVMYSTEVSGVFTDGYPLNIDGLADRAIIFINGEKVAVYERGREYEEIIIKSSGKLKIDILVENCGRVNFGPFLFDRKGLASVRIGQRYIYGWKMRSLKHDGLSNLDFKADLTPSLAPCFYRAKINVDEINDTFLRLDGFGKGYVIINGHNIGRYYTAAGPQKTLYVPACWLNSGENEIFIFDSDGTSELNAEFTDKPQL